MFGNWSGPWNTSFVLQDLPVQAGQTLTLSGYAMHVTGDLLQGDNYALLKISWFDGPNGTGSILQPLPGPGTLFGEYAGVESAAITRDSTVDTWHSLSVSAVAPEGTMSALALVIFVQPTDHAGAAWFEDVSAVLESYAWGENIGWTDWRWDPGTPGKGATIGCYYCSGLIWSENVGWIQLGTGAPANGVHYGNTDGADYGVNHDGKGGLSGLAWGENIGWITFDQSVSAPPRIDLATGKFAGYAYGENVGWIDLGSNGTHFVKTTTIDAGPDTDLDMIADAWELEQAEAAGLGAALTHLDQTTDTDGDGRGDLDEYLADTNPFNSADYFHIVSIGRDEATSEILLEWASSPRRLYEIGSTTTLNGFSMVFDNVAPGPGTTTAVMFADPVVERKFWQVGAKLPLAPPAP